MLSLTLPEALRLKDANLSVAPATVPTITNNSANPADWLQPVANTSLTFNAENAGAANGITFRPLYDVHHERYSAYWSMKSN